MKILLFFCRYPTHKKTFPSRKRKGWNCVGDIDSKIDVWPRKHDSLKHKTKRWMLFHLKDDMGTTPAKKIVSQKVVEQG